MRKNEHITHPTRRVDFSEREDVSVGMLLPVCERREKKSFHFRSELWISGKAHAPSTKSIYHNAARVLPYKNDVGVFFSRIKIFSRKDCDGMESWAYSEGDGGSTVGWRKAKTNVNINRRKFFIPIAKSLREKN